MSQLAQPAPQLPQLPEREFPFTAALFAAVILSSLCLAAWQLAGGVSEESALLFTRYTARVSFIFFLPVFTLQALHQVARTPVSGYLMKRRRQLGLAFALAHAVHLVAIMMYYQAVDRWFSGGDIPALVIYFFIGLMAITSNSLSIRTLKKGWKVLHWVGLYGIFVGFFVTYLGRVQGYDSADIDPALKESYAVYVLLLTLVSAAWLLRIFAFARKRFA